MKVIAIETATDVCSVALLEDEKVIVEISLTTPRAHAENLVPLLQDALRYAGVKPDELEGIAVSMGPGSYTGLRIGVSTAKGMAWAVDASLIGIPSLLALAHTVKSSLSVGDVIIPSFKSRRDELYVAIFQKVSEEDLEPVGGTRAFDTTDPAAFEPILESGDLWAVGEGAPRLTQVLKERTKQTVRLLDPQIYLPSAAWIGRLAMRRLKRNDIDDLASFEPFYLKEFVAKKRQKTIFDRLNL